MSASQSSRPRRAAKRKLQEDFVDHALFEIGEDDDEGLEDNVMELRARDDDKEGFDEQQLAMDVYSDGDDSDRSEEYDSEEEE